MHHQVVGIHTNSKDGNKRNKRTKEQNLSVSLIIVAGEINTHKYIYSYTYTLYYDVSQECQQKVNEENKR